MNTAGIVALSCGHMLYIYFQIHGNDAVFVLCAVARPAWTTTTVGTGYGWLLAQRLGQVCGLRELGVCVQDVGVR